VTIRVLVADDQSIVRAGFRMLLTGEQDIEVVAEASNRLEAVAQTRRLNPAVVLIDIRMPEVDGIEAARRILAANSAARILILTTFGLDEYIYEALCGRPPRAAVISPVRVRPRRPEKLRGLHAGRIWWCGWGRTRVLHYPYMSQQLTADTRHRPPSEARPHLGPLGTSGPGAQRLS
jgi:CheY-like chemotaxis protein